MKSIPDIETAFACEAFLENVFEIPVLLKEVREAAAAAISGKKRRKKIKAELDIDTMLRIESVLGRLIRVEDELSFTRGRFEEIRTKVERARSAYNYPDKGDPKNDRASHKKRLSLIAHELEFTTGKREKSHDSSGLFWDYLTLRTCGSMIATELLVDRGELVEVKPMSKGDALPILQKKYKHTSLEATDKALRREIARRRARGASIPNGF